MQGFAGPPGHMSCRASSASPPRQSQSGAGLPGPAQSGVGAGSALSSGFQPLSPGPRSPCHLAMDAALALQVGEAVAEKVLRYRRDESGWRTCRQGVSGGWAGGVPGRAPPLPLAAAPWRWDAEMSRGGCFLKNIGSLCLQSGDKPLFLSWSGLSRVT